MKAQRQALASDHPARQVESTVSEITSASLDFGRALRDAAAEATFFQIYGNSYAFYLGDGQRRRNGGADRGPARASVRQGSIGFDRQRWLRGGARAGWLPDGSQGRAAAAFPGAPCAGTARRLPRPAARPASRRGAPHRRRAGNHRALRAGKGGRDAARPAGKAEGPRSPAHAARARARRQAGATHPAFAGANRDAHAHPSRAWLGRPPPGNGPGAATDRARSRRQTQDDP